jgi:hypothetical protein
LADEARKGSKRRKFDGYRSAAPMFFAPIPTASSNLNFCPGGAE